MNKLLTKDEWRKLVLESDLLYETQKSKLESGYREGTDLSDMFEAFTQLATEAILAKLRERVEPVAWMLECQNPGNGTSWRLSWSRSGAGVCNRLPGEASERPLYEHATPPVLPVELTREEISLLAMDGFSLSTMHGQAAHKLMPISDIATLEAFARAVIAAHDKKNGRTR